MNREIFNRLAEILSANEKDICWANHRTRLSDIILPDSWHGSGIYQGSFSFNHDITYLIFADSFKDNKAIFHCWNIPIDQFKKMVKDTISLLKDFEDFHC